MLTKNRHHRQVLENMRSVKILESSCGCTSLAQDRSMLLSDFELDPQQSLRVVGRRTDHIEISEVETSVIDGKRKVDCYHDGRLVKEKGADWHVTSTSNRDVSSY